MEKGIIENDGYPLFTSEDNVQVMCSNFIRKSINKSMPILFPDPSLASLLSEWLCSGCQSFPAGSWCWTQGCSSDQTRKTSSTSLTYGAARSGITRISLNVKQALKWISGKDIQTWKIQNIGRKRYREAYEVLQRKVCVVKYLFKWFEFEFGVWRYAAYLDVGTGISHHDDTLTDLADYLGGSMMLYTITLSL